MQHIPARPPAPLILTRERGRVALRMVCVPMGRDLAVALDGGDRAHIGAVAVSQARPSHEPDGGISATTSVITLPGHKEDDLARAVATRLATGLDATVCVACGIHLDAIQSEEIKKVLELAEELSGEALARLRGAHR